MEAQYKLKYALKNINIEKVNQVLKTNGTLSGDYELIFHRVSDYIDAVEEQSDMFHKELGPYRFIRDVPLNSDAAKVQAFVESVEIIAAMKPETVPDMLSIVESKQITPGNPVTLVKETMWKILPELQ
jgi:hypothetical protein